MSRTAEAVLVLAAAGLAAFGVLLVDFAGSGASFSAPGLIFLWYGAVFGGFLAAIRRWAPRAVPFLIPPAATIAAIGYVMVYRLDRGLADRQRWWLLIGAGLAALLLFWLRGRGLAVLRRRPWIWPASAAGLAVLPALPRGGPLPLGGLELGGARLWVEWQWGPDVFLQPGEAAKLMLAVFLAMYLSDRQSALSAGGPRLGRLRLPGLHPAAALGSAWAVGWAALALYQDLGASLMLFGLFVVMLYAATNRAAYLGIGFGGYALGAAGAYFLFEQVRRQAEVWIDPWSHYEGAGYQTVQGLFALGAGSLSGAGLGLGRPDLIPDVAFRFPLAAVAEEMGLAGSVAVLAAYALLAAAGFGVALRSRDLFRKLAAAGLTLLIGLQAAVSAAGTVRLLPAPGLPAPFLSYGGSSIVTAFLALALLARISHEERT